MTEHHSKNRLTDQAAATLWEWTGKSVACDELPGPVVECLAKMARALRSHKRADLLTTAQAAHYLHRSASTLTNWRESGRGPQFLRANGRIFYRPADLEAWLDSCTVASNADQSQAEQSYLNPE